MKKLFSFGTSLWRNVQRSYIFILFIMILPTLYALTVSYLHTKEYDSIIENILLANRINRVVKDNIPNELWSIVSGRKTFAEGCQYEMMDRINSTLDYMMESEGAKGSLQKLEVARRASITLERNISLLGLQISEGQSVAKNQDMLDEIRSITSLFSDILLDFIVTETENSTKTNDSIRRSSLILILSLIAVILLSIAMAVHGFRAFTRSFSKPVREMENLSTQIARGNLTARVVRPHIDELDTLADNLNTMAVQIDLLMKQNIQEQINLQKAEMKALQSQITPHFLYNTFDTIIWLAEENKNSDVIKVTRAFSEFLRTSLSRGHEWISIEQEMDHVRNYLTIQKVRYNDILNYEIESETSFSSFSMLKLILQPLVENAIYHGIKNKRGRGQIKVSARFEDAKMERIYFSVEDNGAGFTPERLNEVRETLLGNTKEENLTSVYGLYNVNKRLILYYNGQTDGLHIESEKSRGCKIWFTVPVKKSL